MFRTSDEILAQLGQHPSWTYVDEVIKSEAEKRSLLLAKKRLGGTVISEEEWEYNRGFFAGMRFLQRLILGETKKLQQELDEFKKGEA